MRLFLAIFLPGISFFTIRRPFAGICCLVLQITLLGWLPATIWAVYALSMFKSEQRLQAALNNIRVAQATNS